MTVCTWFVKKINKKTVATFLSVLCLHCITLKKRTTSTSSTTTTNDITILRIISFSVTLFLTNCTKRNLHVNLSTFTQQSQHKTLLCQSLLSHNSIRNRPKLHTRAVVRNGQCVCAQWWRLSRCNHTHTDRRKKSHVPRQPWPEKVKSFSGVLTTQQKKQKEFTATIHREKSCSFFPIGNSIAVGPIRDVCRQCRLV